jgi:predicted small integral membrane protein
MSWMAWTPYTAAFFAAIALALIGMTLWELKRPTHMAQGFLPMSTTRGDRFFISLLSAAFIHLFWLASIADNLVIASALSVAWGIAVMRRG